MSQVTDTQMNTMSKALAQLRANVQSVISNMQNDTFFADARWSVVVATTKIQNPYNSFQRSVSCLCCSQGLKAPFWFVGIDCRAKYK